MLFSPSVMERSESAPCKVLHVSLEQALFGFTLLGCDTVFSAALPTAATPRISWQHLGEETVHRPIVHQTAVPIETGSAAAQKRFGQGHHHQGASAAARRGAERRLPAWHCGIHGIVRCSDSRARGLVESGSKRGDLYVRSTVHVTSCACACSRDVPACPSPGATRSRSPASAAGGEGGHRKISFLPWHWAANRPSPFELQVQECRRQRSNNRRDCCNSHVLFLPQGCKAGNGR